MVLHINFCTSCTKLYLFFFTCENFDICTILENSGQLCNISSSLSPHGGRAITLAHKLKQPNQQPSGLFLIQAWTTINFTLTFENLVKSDSTLFASPTLWCSTLCVGQWAGGGYILFTFISESTLACVICQSDAILKSEWKKMQYLRYQTILQPNLILLWCELQDPFNGLYMST